MAPCRCPGWAACCQLASTACAAVPSVCLAAVLQKSHEILYVGRDRPGQLHSLYQASGRACLLCLLCLLCACTNGRAPAPAGVLPVWGGAASAAASCVRRARLLALTTFLRTYICEHPSISHLLLPDGSFCLLRFSLCCVQKEGAGNYPFGFGTRTIAGAGPALPCPVLRPDLHSILAGLARFDVAKTLNCVRTACCSQPVITAQRSLLCRAAGEAKPPPGAVVSADVSRAKASTNLPCACRPAQGAAAELRRRQGPRRGAQRPPCRQRRRPRARRREEEQGSSHW